MDLKKLGVKAAAVLGICLFFLSRPATAQVKTAASLAAPEKVIIDTDIGDDIDDAFAVGLALASKELDIVGITSAWGNTSLRLQLLDRLLCETGRSDIPVATGIATHSMTEFSQSAWAKQGRQKQHPDAVAFLLGRIRNNPGQITLIAIAPLTNIGAAIDQDPQTFRKLKRAVVMGGSIRRGYNGENSSGPDPEYNIRMDIPAARKLISSGVPIYLMPLDSTMIPFDEVMRQQLFTASTPLTDALALLYLQWTRTFLRITPTLFDAVPVAYAIQPELCPPTPLHIEIDADGFTRESAGPANVQACLQSDTQKFLQFYMPRLLNQRLSGDEVCRASPDAEP